MRDEKTDGKQNVVLRAGGVDSCRVALADCRKLLKAAAEALIAPSPSDNLRQTSLPLGESLGTLEGMEETLNGLLIDPPEDHFNDSVRLVLGLMHSTLAKLQDAMGGDSSDLSQYHRACVWFDAVPPTSLAADEDASRQYIQALEKVGKHPEALKFLGTAVSLGKLSMSFYVEFARALDRPEDTDFRTKIWVAALNKASDSKASDSAKDLRELADALEWAGQSELAVEALWTATERYADRRDWKSALEVCEHALRIRPEHPQINAVRACLLVEVGRLSEAILELRRAQADLSDPAVRVFLAKALMLSGAAEQALIPISEVLSIDARNVEAICIRAGAFNRMANWLPALQSAESALSQQSSMRHEAMLQKAIALHGLGQFEASLDAVEEVLEQQPQNRLASILQFDLRLKLYPKSALSDAAAHVPDMISKFLELGPECVLVAKPLLQVLRRLEQWDQIIRIIDRLREVEGDSQDLITEKCSALRRLGRQDEALLELSRMPPSSHAEPRFVHLKSALLCDAGDFSGALELLLPITSTIEPLTPQILPLMTLRGWADQNCSGKDYEIDGERVYRQILDFAPEDLWSRKGLANALLRLGEKEEAFEHYGKVITAAENMKAHQQLDPYDSILAGWCYYSTDRFKRAAEFYEAGLAAAEIGIAAEFDYALVLLADSSFSAARFQYERSISDTRGKNALRRCGLLYVALLDLRNAFSHLASVRESIEAYEFRELLRNTLQETIQSLSPDWDHLVKRMMTFLESDELEAASAQATVTPARALGIKFTDWNRPCAILSLVLGPQEQDSSFHPLLRASLWPAKEHSGSDPKKVFWISQSMLNGVGLDAPNDFAEELRWEAVQSPGGSWAAITTHELAQDLSDKAAKLFIDKSIALLTEYYADNDEQKLSAAASTAEYALAASCGNAVMYQALVSYGAAGGDCSEEGLRCIRCGIPADLLAHTASLEEHIEDFKELIRYQARIIQDEAEQKQVVDPPKSKSPSNDRIEYILSRARTISQIMELDEQDRSAAQAATEMQLLVQLTQEREPCYEALGDKLTSEGTFYLEDDESVLIMSREPAFYCSSVMRSLGKRRMIDSVQFTLAAKRQSSLPGLIAELNREQSLQVRILWNRK